MKKIGIMPNLSKDLEGIQTKLVIEKIRDKGFEPFVMPEIYEIIGTGHAAGSSDFSGNVMYCLFWAGWNPAKRRPAGLQAMEYPF